MWLDKSVLSLPEAAQKLGCSEWKIRELIRTGKLVAYQNCKHGKWNIPEEAIVQYKAERLRERAQRA